MDHLDEISVEELQDALNNVEGNKPTQRLLAAIAYKNGVTQTELAEWHDTGQRTIYSWLMRLDTDEPLERAVSNDHRSGRKQKLSESRQNKFEQTVHEPPEEVGIDAPAWTPALLQEFLEDTYGVEYSYPSCRRLLKEAGLSYQSPRRTAAEAEQSDQEEFHDEIKKVSGDGRQSSLHRPNQKIVQVEPRGFCAARGRPSNFPANATGRACSARSPKTANAFCHDSPSTSPPITRNISLSRYAKNSKKT